MWPNTVLQLAACSQRGRRCRPLASLTAAAETTFGAEKSQRRELVLQRLQLFFSRFRSLPFDDPAAETYGSLRATLEKAGRPIGPNDLLIASIAMANRLVLVTHNTEEFSRIPDLDLEDWES